VFDARTACTLGVAVVEAQSPKPKAQKGSLAVASCVLVGVLLGSVAGAAFSVYWQRAELNGYSICGLNAAVPSGNHPPSNGLIFTDLYQASTCDLGNPTSHGWIEVQGELWKESAGGQLFKCSPTIYNHGEHHLTVSISTGSPWCSQPGYFWAVSTHGGFIQGHPFRAHDQGFPLVSLKEWFA